MAEIKKQETWRRQLLEKKLKGTIDWHYTELKDAIEELKNVYETNLKRRMRNRVIFWMKGLSTCLKMVEPVGHLKKMYADYEDFIKNCNGFVCSTEEGCCGCLECK